MLANASTCFPCRRHRAPPPASIAVTAHPIEMGDEIGGGALREPRDTSPHQFLLTDGLIRSPCLPTSHLKLYDQRSLLELLLFFKLANWQRHLRKRAAVRRRLGEQGKAGHGKGQDRAARYARPQGRSRAVAIEARWRRTPRSSSHARRRIITKLWRPSRKSGIDRRKGFNERHERQSSEHGVREGVPRLRRRSAPSVHLCE